MDPGSENFKALASGHWPTRSARVSRGRYYQQLRRAYKYRSSLPVLCIPPSYPAQQTWSISDNGFHVDHHHVLSCLGPRVAALERCYRQRGAAAAGAAAVAQA